MNRFFPCMLATNFLWLVSSSLSAQTLMDGFSKEKGDATFVLSYTRESYDEFFLGDEQVDLTMAGFNQIVTQSITLYAEYGLSDRLDIILNLPYISAEARADAESPSASGLQNAAIMLEWMAVEQNSDAGTFSATGGIGLSAPLSDYATNVIYAIGNRAVSLDPKVLLQYKFNSGLFLNGQAGYSFRSNEVPNATLLSAKLGYAGAGFYIDAFLAQQWSNGGIDIGSEGFTPERFPETTVNTTTLGFSAFAPLAGAVGITVGAGTRLAGRNAGLPNYFTAGLVFSL